MGGGGGAGTSNNGTGGAGENVVVENGFRSSGTAGGGIVIINTNQIAGTGAINVNGADNTFAVNNDGAGGGGAGGSIVLLSQSTNLSNITVLAQGGQGGNDNLNTTAGHGPGGGGSAGVVFTSSPISTSSVIAPGASGLTGGSNGNFSFGSTVGTQFAGLVRNTIIQGDVPNITQASNCTALPLPVELIQFDAKALGAQVHLTWTTASEKNNRHFEVERSLDGQTFAQIGTVTGHGTTSQKQEYTFTDDQVSQHASLLYYRLRQVDENGEATYSPVRMVTLKSGRAKFTLSPNPATDEVTVDLTALPAGTYYVSFHDVSGRRVGAEQVLTGRQATVVSVASLPAGVYLLTVQGAQQVQTQRLVKY
jgi:hypothetical protein